MRTNPGKAVLLARIEGEHAKLEALLRPLSAGDMARPGLTSAGWTPTDLVAHLSDWERRAAEWSEAGLRGEPCAVPGEGYTWQDLPRLNADVIAVWRERSLDEVRAAWQSSYERLLATVRAIDEADLVTPDRFSWTGPGWSLAQFVAECSSEHYRWARGLVRPWLRTSSAAATRAV